jgi:hypothetical protein
MRQVTKLAHAVFEGSRAPSFLDEERRPLARNYFTLIFLNQAEQHRRFYSRVRR